ncbi:MAG: membrane protein of unknown function [Candidatus Thorarchaeota archaeon]|nr:MAG: membrane protein of unknown function [Candidatus Thorarchaeota archaeon]
MVKNSRTYREISLLYIISLLLSIVTNFIIIIVMRFFGSEMYPFFITLYIWIAAYMLLLSVLLRGIRFDYLSFLSNRNMLIIISILTIGSRAMFLGMNEFISLDSLWYLDFGNFMANGNIPYYDFYFPYPPVFGYFIYLIYILVPSVDSFRILAISFDVLVVILLWRVVVRKSSSSWGNFVGLAYAMLPMSVIESGWNGHFESMVAFFVLLSVYFLLCNRHVLSGVLLGLATATKLFPGLLLPVFVFYFRTWRSRIEFVISTVISALLSLLPFLVPIWLRSDDTTATASFNDTSGIIEIMLKSVFDPTAHPLIITVLLFTGIGFLILAIIIQFLRDNDNDNVLPYNIVSGVFGVVLIAMGMIAGWYPLSLESRLVYWRYPADVGIVRAITAGAAGLVIISMAYRRWKRGELEWVSKETLLILVSTVLLLMLSMTREVFYGWYLLWSIPLLFLLNDRRLFLMAILALLLIYPSYTHDNFNSLGYEEERIWSEEFNSAQGWSKYINRSNSGIPSGVITAETYIDESRGHFSIDTSSVSDAQKLDNVSIVFKKNYAFRVEKETEFVIRLTCSWDPTFGQYADMSLDFFGEDTQGHAIKGTIIPMTSAITNLTNLLWRFSFSSILNCNTSCIIDELVLTVYPVRMGEYRYSIDYMYTTRAGPLNPRYILISITLVTISFAAYVLLNIELHWAVSGKRHC